MSPYNEFMNTGAEVKGVQGAAGQGRREEGGEGTDKAGGEGGHGCSVLGFVGISGVYDIVAHYLHEKVRFFLLCWDIFFPFFCCWD